VDDSTKELVLLVIGSIVTQIISIIVVSIKSGSKELKELSLSFVRLSTQMEHVLKAVEDFPKFKHDVDAAHKKLRNIENERSF
jgi:hypothetical protein